MKLTKLTFIIILFGLLPEGIAQKNDLQRISSLIRSCDSLIYDQPQKSLDFALAANELARELKNDSLIALSLNRVGSAHWSLGNQMQALEKIQESLQISELNNFEGIMAKNLGNIGNVYGASGLDLDAIGYYRSELAIQKTNRDTFRLFAINNNIGKAFVDLNYFDSAHHYFESASNFLDPKFEHLHSIYYFNLAELNFKEGNSIATDSLIKLTTKNAERFNSARGIIRANQLRAEWLLSMDDAAKALNHAEIAFNLAMQSGVKELIYITSKTLSRCYGRLNRFREAFEKQLLHERYLDSVQSITTVNELELLSYYQRLFQMRVLESKNTVNKELAEQRQLIIQGLVVALLIAAILIAIIILVVRELGMRKRQLEKLNAFRSKIFAIVSHDLKSPIQSVSSVIELFNEKLISKEEIEPVLPEVREKTSNLMNLLNNIFLWAEGQMEGEYLRKETFVLYDIVNELENELTDRLAAKKIMLNYESAKDFKVFSDPGIIRILLRNLIVNAIKYSNVDSTVEVNAVKGEKVRVIEVIDNGIGMTPEIKENILKGELASTDGTEGEKGNGLGLTLCFDFVNSLGGQLEIESVLGEGSVFRIILNDEDVPL